MDLDYKSMGMRISRRRKALGIRQNALADEIDISNNYLSGIECGKEKPSLDILIRICNALQITPDYLIMGTMHSSNVPQNIVDGLRLCSPEDVGLVSDLIQIMIKRRNDEWSTENYI